jgi:arginyl-tRNA synthetase
MKSTLTALNNRVAEAIANAFDFPALDVNPRLARTQDDQFGDYQCNAAMGLAKQLSAKPRDVAEKIKNHLNIDDLCEPPDIAGPGFINLRLKPNYLADQLVTTPPRPTDHSDRLGLPTTDRPETVVVDMSSPNLAKEMHVGHLRSTVIGDCVARILEFAGHHVHRVNHVGDWGTQFGMLLEYVRQTQPEALTAKDALVIADLEKFYIEAKKRFDDDETFAERARKTVVELQSNDPDTMRVWKAFCHESLRHCHVIYDQLGVRNLVDQGESFYGPLLADVVDEIKETGASQVSEGALCVFLDGFTTRDGDPLPMIIRKSDGGYNYDTTDLAAIRYRLRDLRADRIIYVVGAPQKQHFDMLFAAARKIGWVKNDNALTHLAFGSVLAANGRPFKTRTGGNIKLIDLLHEAESRARNVVQQNAEKGGDREAFDEATISDIASAVAMGAVKYFDLSHNLTSDYRFDFDHMLAMEGNTAPYMLYACARIRSIIRKAAADSDSVTTDLESAPITLEHESEIRLAKAILRFPEVTDAAATDLRPNVLTDYLFELSKTFNLFYDRKLGVRVLNAETKSLMTSRLRLCDITARVLDVGLNLLGIRTIERM